MPEITDINHLEQKILRRFEDRDPEPEGFNILVLYDILDNVRREVISREVAEKVDERLDSHLRPDELHESAHRLGSRPSPPPYLAFALEVLGDELNDWVRKPDPRELGENVLYCFDRDMTVEAGIPRGPVSLRTVRRLADNNPMYATGNQHLRMEADIPGVDDLREEQVSREQGIALVCHKEYENIDAAVAVDDVDVSGVRDLDVYYEPWEFYLLMSE